MTNNKIRPINYVYYFFLLYLSNGYILSAYEGYVVMEFLLAVTAVGALANHRQIKIEMSILMTVVLFFLIIFLNTLFTMESVKMMILTLAYFLTALMFVCIISYEDFCTIFTNVMTFVCVCSLVGFVLAEFFPQMLSFFPVAENVLGIEAYNLFFTVTRPSEYMVRNMGFFWEPGAFQTFINLALLIHLIKNDVISKPKVIIYIVTIITTFSTTGYIAMLMILLLYLYTKLTDGSRQASGQIKLLFGFLLLTLIFFVVYVNLPENTKYQLFGKVETHFSDSADTTKMTSTSVRMDALRYPFLYFLKYPILGGGYEGLRTLAKAFGYEMSTCTFINWFALYGLVFGIVCNFGIYAFSTALNKRMALWIFVIILTAIFSEDYSRNPSILLFIYYGIIECFRVREKRKHGYIS